MLKRLQNLWKLALSKIDYWLVGLGLLVFGVFKWMASFNQTAESGGMLSFEWDIFQAIPAGLVPLGAALSIAFIVMKLVVPNGKAVFDTMFTNDKIKPCQKAWLSLCLFLGVAFLALTAVTTLLA